MSFRKSDAIHSSMDELLERLSNAYACWNSTGTKTHQDQINMIEGEIKRRVGMIEHLIKKYERKAQDNDQIAEKARRNDKNDWGGKKLTIDVQNRQFEAAWERARVYRSIADELRSICITKK